jgi:tyrosine-specific transport protein
MSQRPPVLSTALLIAGAAVGAGILGMPVQTGLAGFGPTTIGLLIMALAMWVNAWILAEGLIRRGAGKEDLAWLFHQELGQGGRWLTIAGYLINYYGVMVAYLAGAGAVLAALFKWEAGQSALTLGFFVPATALTLFGVAVVRRGNALLMLLLGASFLYLLWRSWQGMQPARLTYTDWGYLPSVLPIIMCSLAFHNMVPLTCRSLEFKRGPIMAALGLGTLATLVLSLFLTAAVVGALPLQSGDGASLWSAFQADQPATVPLAQSLKAPGIMTAGSIFSICAILTSYLAVGTALMGFWRDLWPGAKRWSRAALTFIPPIIVVYLYPNLFLEALDLAGGLGVGLVFGVAPALVLLRWRPASPWLRLGGWALLILFAGIVSLELAQEAGWLHINPNVEYWTSYQPRSGH